jgi:hypothetical protein
MFVGGAAAACSRMGKAQHADRIPRIGVTVATAEDDPVTKARVTAFRQALQALGSSASGARVE